jgi:hypothetical protein
MMAVPPDLDACLNCGAKLQGAFCAACGQRSIPPNPTVAELAGDAWREMTGYDGRIAATARGLVRPGFLTREYMEGRRFHYLPPLRLYLMVSVLYFLVAVGAPAGARARSAGEVTGPGGLRIGVTGGDYATLTPEDKAEILRQLDRSPWYLRPMLKSVAEDPEAFRLRMFSIMPRVFFGLVPVFGLIVALFHRRHHFPTTLVFAVHLHAFAFVLFTLSEAAKYPRILPLELGVGLVAVMVFVTYALRAFRTVFGGGWPVTIAKALGIGFVYLFASIPAFLIILYWASLT